MFIWVIMALILFVDKYDSCFVIDGEACSWCKETSGPYIHDKNTHIVRYFPG